MGWKVKAVIFPLCAYILSFLVAMFVYGMDLLGGIKKISNETSYEAESFDIDTEKADTIKKEEVIFKPSTVINPSEDIVNILLVGKDIKEGEMDSGRTDSMILLSLNRNTKKVSMVSFMRDCYVQIPGHSNNKLNAAYSMGGYQLLNQTIELNFGVHVDYNVGVNFTSFMDIINTLGGIDIKLTKEEADYILEKTKKESGLTEGMNHLTGKQALWYARTRKVGTGKENNDFGRTSRQRVVLETVYREAMKSSLTKIIDIAYEVTENIETDMSTAEIISLATEIYSMDIGSIQSHRIPNDKEYTDEVINRMMVLVVDFEKAQEHLQEWIYD